jgi:hypothetical protein
VSRLQNIHADVETVPWAVVSGIERQEREAQYSPLSSIKVKNRRSSTFTPLMCLPGVYRDRCVIPSFVVFQKVWDILFVFTLTNVVSVTFIIYFGKSVFNYYIGNTNEMCFPLFPASISEQNNYILMTLARQIHS